MGPCCLSMALPWVVDNGTADKRWSSNLEVGKRVNHHKQINMLQNVTQCHRLGWIPRYDLRNGILSVRSPCSLGHLKTVARE
jgi:hypothetical protein